jgi:hypothetical protein
MRSVSLSCIAADMSDVEMDLMWLSFYGHCNKDGQFIMQLYRCSRLDGVVSDLPRCLNDLRVWNHMKCYEWLYETICASKTTPFFIVTAVKTSNLTQNTCMATARHQHKKSPLRSLQNCGITGSLSIQLVHMRMAN